jgi:hypothetical protein
LLGGLITGTLGWPWVCWIDLPVRIEKHSAPLVPFRALRSRVLIGGNLVVLSAGMTVDGMLVTLTAYAQRVLGRPAMRFGLMARRPAAWRVSGRWARFGVRRVTAVGTILLAGACALLRRDAAHPARGTPT